MANEKWAELHGEVKVSRFIEFWLNISKILAQPFIFLRLSPNVISILAVAISFPLIYNPNYWWLVLVALFLDGVDGQVAIARNMATKAGAVIDSLSDRTVEFIWAVTLYLAGLNLIAIALFIGLAWIQEYLRARAGGLGFKNIGLVTIGERPTRGVFLLLILIVTTFSGLILWIAAVVQGISLATLIYKFEKEINR